ncbi:MAG: hypothetical protein IPI81_13875 [Flavobacteriales bacterium]|nr:hypothetical protein [Flavobacteriales bacterium]MCC6937391.1 hypothetical protein [Flavobacteriales bacterium]
MSFSEASFTGTLRTIAVLVILWWVLRLILRSNAKGPVGPQPPQRPKGDVRIEPAQGNARGGANDPDIIDADFEEIK